MTRRSLASSKSISTSSGRPVIHACSPKHSRRYRWRTECAGFSPVVTAKVCSISTRSRSTFSIVKLGGFRVPTASTVKSWTSASALSLPYSTVSRKLQMSDRLVPSSMGRLVDPHGLLANQHGLPGGGRILRRGSACRGLRPAGSAPTHRPRCHQRRQALTSDLGRGDEVAVLPAQVAPTGLGESAGRRLDSDTTACQATNQVVLDRLWTGHVPTGFSAFDSKRTR